MSNTASPYAPIEAHLTVEGGDAAIAFYEKAFGATAASRMPAEDGKRLMHAVVNVFGAQIMLADHFPEYQSDAAPPSKLGGAGVTMHVNLASPAEVDAAMDRAAKAGAIITMPAQDTFWGMRYGRLKDPFGHSWAFGALLAKQPS